MLSETMREWEREGGARVLPTVLALAIAQASVLAGPVEATAIGNVLIQARTPGAVDSTLEGMRNLVRNTFSVRKYLPKEPLR